MAISTTSFCDDVLAGKTARFPLTWEDADKKRAVGLLLKRLWNAKRSTKFDRAEYIVLCDRVTALGVTLTGKLKIAEHHETQTGSRGGGSGKVKPVSDPMVGFVQAVQAISGSRYATPKTVRAMVDYVKKSVRMYAPVVTESDPIATRLWEMYDALSPVERNLMGKPKMPRPVAAKPADPIDWKPDDDDVAGIAAKV